MISIILPHLHTSICDESLSLCKRAIASYTSAVYELIIDDTPNKCPYKKYNEGAKKAKYEILIFCNTDMIFAPGWDIMVKFVEDNVIVMGYLVESGRVGVASQNIEKDFGKLPSIFRQQEFEKFCLEHARKNNIPEIKQEMGWYMPCAVNKKWFLNKGGFDTHKKVFPECLDVDYFEKCKKDSRFKLLRAKSYAYHFQALSNRSQPIK